jgi:type VI secretion system protein ImpF
MSRGTENSRIVLSVVDRLLDDDPQTTQEQPLDEFAQIKLLQHAIRRDLENLLNTRSRCTAWPPRYTELENSLVNYGLPDFTSAGFNAASDPEILVEAIRRAIELFEPRLTNVQIRHVQDEYYFNRTFQFRIEATLIINEKKHLVLYDSVLESSTGQFNVK